MHRRGLALIVAVGVGVAGGWADGPGGAPAAPGTSAPGGPQSPVRSSPESPQEAPAGKAPADKPPPAQPPTDQKPGAASAFERLTPTQQRLVRDQAKYYVKLKDGRCLCAFRLLRALELEENTKARARESELEALDALGLAGDKPDGPEHRVERRGLPDWVEYVEDVVVVGFDPSWTPSKKLSVVPPWGTPRRAAETYVYVNAPNAEETVVRVKGSQPTPEQLADCLVRENKPLRQYVLRTETRQPTRTIPGVGTAGFREDKVVNDGPPIVTHSWEEKKIPLRPRAEGKR